MAWTVNSTKRMPKMKRAIQIVIHLRKCWRKWWRKARLCTVQRVGYVLKMMHFAFY